MSKKRYQVVLTNQFGIYPADPKELTPEQHEELQEFLKKSFESLYLFIDGDFFLFKGAAIQDCVISVKELPL